MAIRKSPRLQEIEDADEREDREVELPTMFVYEGIRFPAGKHTVNARVADDLEAAVERFNERRSNVGASRRRADGSVTAMDKNTRRRDPIAEMEVPDESEGSDAPSATEEALEQMQEDAQQEETEETEEVPQPRAKRTKAQRQAALRARRQREE